MRPVRLLVMAAALGLMSSAALGFEEQRSGAGPAGAAPTRPAPRLDDKSSLGLSTPELPAKESSGTEVRIPGLGKLGVLPKLDFGLELLYGAGESKRMEEDKGPDDLTIRGSVRHRF
jgi:hypothetical protein